MWYWNIMIMANSNSLMEASRSNYCRIVHRIKFTVKLQFVEWNWFEFTAILFTPSSAHIRIYVFGIKSIYLQCKGLKEIFDTLKFWNALFWLHDNNWWSCHYLNIHSMIFAPIKCCLSQLFIPRENIV